jgi:Domain of unknown function (DUF4129)
MTTSWRRPASRLAAGVLAGGPMIGRRAGQRLARQELSEMSFWQRVLNAFQHFFNASANAVPGGWFGLIVLAVLAVLGVTVVVFWVRPSRTRRLGSGALLSGQPRSAQDHRREAQRLAAASDFSGAIVEGVRAIAVELDERDILPPRPGRTADELAHEAGRALPLLAHDLRLVSGLFDDVLYGDRPGTHEGYKLVSRVDEAVRSARQTEILTLAGVPGGRPPGPTPPGAVATDSADRTEPGSQVPR